jgi:hypothetical protein
MSYQMKILKEEKDIDILECLWISVDHSRDCLYQEILKGKGPLDASKFFNTDMIHLSFPDRKIRNSRKKNEDLEGLVD